MRLFWQQSGCSKQATLTEYGKQRWSDYRKNECNRVPSCSELPRLTTISDKTSGKSSGFLLHIIDYLTEIYWFVHTHTQPSEIQLLGGAARNNPEQEQLHGIYFCLGSQTPQVRKDARPSPKISTWEVCLEELRCNCSDPHSANTTPSLLLGLEGGTC